LQLDRLDLAAETGQPLRLSGSLEVRGGLEAYTGRFELNNQGTDLTTASLAGKFNGDRQKLALSDLQGQWLSGRLGGQLQLGWEQGWQAQAQLTGSDLDPRLLSPQLSGQLSPQLLLDFQQTGPGKRSGRLQLYLGESMLHGQPLTGEALLQLQDNVLRVEKLQLLGDGLALQASGNPGERLKFHGQIDRLEQLLSETAGRISADGWLRWRQQTLVMEFHAAGKQLAFREWRLADLALRGGTEDSGKTWRLQLAGQQLQTPPAGSTIDRVKLELQGTPAEHQLTLYLSQGESHLAAGLQGGWDQHQWQGKLTRFQGDDARFGSWLLGQSAPLMISPALIRVGPLLLRDNKGGEVALHGSYQPSSQQADGELRWQALDLGMLRPWLADWRISGQSSGSLELRREPQHVFHGDISFSGELQRQLQLKLSQSQMILDWDQQGLRSSLQLQLVDGGSLHGTMTSADPATMALPQQAELQLTGDEIPLVLFRPWLPPELNVSGKLSITASGSWQAGESPNLEGSAKTAEARLSWLEDEGVIGTDISATSLSWHWRDRLQGTLELKLKESGNIESRFDLPLPARLPLSFAPDEKLTAELQARLQELGLLSVLFPGRIQESRGHLKLDLQLAGTVRQPSLLGNFHLFDAAAFIPAAGVQLEKIDLQGDFADHQIRLAQLQIKSGGGRLQGNGELELQNWRPGIYRLQLKGENFQLIHLPDLQVSSNPDLQIEGTTEKIKVRGQVKFPDALIKGQQKTALASNSPDLQIVDQKSPAPRQAKLQHDIDVQLLLGDRVLLNTAGIDARLEGSLRLQSTSQQELAANGEIHVAKGKYASYGVSLDITRGNLYFTGGPLDQPALDILALRTAGEVKAGVKVTGTPQVPVVQLYSEPAMADTDILSYIVLGHPIGANGNQSGMLLTAAGALLSQGESVSLQEKLKSRLGLDVLDISAGNGDVNSSIITTGKYLSPELYISLGYSLFTNTNELKVRYNLTPSWELESSIGVESGVDMFYRIEIE